MNRNACANKQNPLRLFTTPRSSSLPTIFSPQNAFPKPAINSNPSQQHPPALNQHPQNFPGEAKKQKILILRRRRFCCSLFAY